MGNTDIIPYFVLAICKAFIVIWVCQWRQIFICETNSDSTSSWGDNWDFNKHYTLFCWVSRGKHIISNMNALLSKSPDLSTGWSTCKSRDLSLISPKLGWLKQSLQMPSTSDTRYLRFILDWYILQVKSFLLPNTPTDPRPGNLGLKQCQKKPKEKQRLVATGKE